MREYALGAMLLDLDDPSRVIGATVEPFVTRDPAERDGYVPQRHLLLRLPHHDGWLYLPYGFGDVGIGFAAMPAADLIDPAPVLTGRQTALILVGFGWFLLGVVEAVARFSIRVR